MILLAHALKLEMAHYRAKQRSIKTRQALKLLRFECAAIIVRELSKSENFNLDIDQVVESLVSAFEVRLYPEVHASIAYALDKGLRLAVVSNFSYLLPIIMQDLGIAKYFEEIVFSAELGIEKPSTKIFTHALDRLECEPNHCIMIGDTYEEDILGASSAGIKHVLISRTHQHIASSTPIARDLLEAVTLAGRMLD